jgi:hypothetical protein
MPRKSLTPEQVQLATKLLCSHFIRPRGKTADDGGTVGGNQIKRLSDEQIERLEKLVANVGEKYRARLLGYMGVESLRDIPANRYRQAVRQTRYRRCNPKHQGLGRLGTSVRIPKDAYREIMFLLYEIVEGPLDADRRAEEQKREREQKNWDVQCATMQACVDYCKKNPGDKYEVILAELAGQFGVTSEAIIKRLGASPNFIMEVAEVFGEVNPAAVRALKTIEAERQYGADSPEFERAWKKAR